MAYPGSSGKTVRFDNIGEAWRLFSANMGNWVLTLLVFALAVGVAYFIGFLLVGGAMLGGGAAGDVAGLAAGSIFGMLVMFVLILAVYGALGAGIFRMAVGEVRGRKAQVGDLFAATDAIVPMLGAALIIGILTFIGNMLCVIPGLIVGGLTLLTYPLIVDRKLPVMEAVQGSINALKSEWLMATIYFLVIALIAGLGSIACGIGILFTLPLYFLSVALLYRDFFPEQFDGVTGFDSGPVSAGPAPNMPPPPTAEG